jgi:hypothetical protein
VATHLALTSQFLFRKKHSKTVKTKFVPLRTGSWIEKRNFKIVYPAVPGSLDKKGGGRCHFLLDKSWQFFRLFFV